MKIYSFCLIEKESKYLVMLKSKMPYWNLPGGHIEDGENSVNCVIRETKEETTLDVSSLILIHELKVYSFRGKKMGVYLYKTNDVKGSVVLNDEHIEYKWVTKKEILKLNVFDYLKEWAQG
ncbi:MAG: NUDIX domain-containing protein [Nanoarchaeota archaeon]|nr:NUDIX domain-containing protein [Nanoarchaeota archaeon]